MQKRMKELLSDSMNSMNMMDEVKVRLKEQEEKLTVTKSQFQSVRTGINRSKDETGEINV